MPPLLKVVRPLARLSPARSTLVFRALSTQTTSKRLDTPAPSKPASRKTTPLTYPDLPNVPPVHGPAPPPSKTQEEMLAAGYTYLVQRTAYNSLPVYRRWKGGGTLELVIIKRITGNVKTLAEDLKAMLGCDPSNVRINPITNHIEIKGAHYDRTRSWMVQQGF